MYTNKINNSLILWTSLLIYFYAKHMFFLIKTYTSYFNACY